MSMVTRRSHRKSRSGCKECKRRRIKCDEDKPQCMNCIRHNIACVYLTTGASPVQSSLPGLTRISTSTSPQSTGEVDSSRFLPPLAGLTINVHPSQTRYGLGDMALLHHWSLATSLTFVSPAHASVWQTTFPQIAFQHPWLMHGILSLAALHLAYLNPSSKRSYMLDAAQHHSISLQAFRERIGQIIESESEALFVNSTLIFLYAFVTFGTLYDESEAGSNTATHTSRVLGADWIPLVRGVRTFLHPTYNCVRVGSLRSMFDTGNWKELDPAAVSGINDTEILKIADIWKGQEDAEIYDDTLYLLRKFCAWIVQFNGPGQESLPEKLGGHQDCSGPFLWVSLAPEQYFKLLQQRQPPALCIFAYFGAILYSLDRYWWMEGCAKNIVEVVDECLGSYWSASLAWPKQVVGLS